MQGDEAGHTSDMADTALSFAMSYAAGLKPLFVPMGLGPRHTRVSIEGGACHVNMGWAFRATIPLSSVRGAEPDVGRVSGWGAHGWDGTWLVNGSSNGLVRIEIEPAARGWMSGIPVRVKVLRLSLEEPEAFLGALRDARSV
jgi:hypothetical protein